MMEKKKNEIKGTWPEKLNREELVKKFYANHDKLKELDPHNEDYHRILSENRGLCDLIVGDLNESE